VAEAPGITDPVLSLKGDFIRTSAPVEAFGRVSGHAWYFRARDQFWEFAVARTLDVSPDAIYNSEQGFYRMEQYGTGSFDASYLPHDNAVAIIRRCAQDFAAELAAEQSEQSSSSSGPLPRRPCS
jgi:hypothetical protein